MLHLVQANLCRGTGVQALPFGKPAPATRRVKAEPCGVGAKARDRDAMLGLHCDADLSSRDVREMVSEQATAEGFAVMDSETMQPAMIVKRASQF